MQDQRQISPGKRGVSGSWRVPGGILGSGFDPFPSMHPARNTNSSSRGAGGLNPPRAGCFAPDSKVSRARDFGAVPAARLWKYPAPVPTVGVCAGVGGTRERQENEHPPQSGGSACSPFIPRAEASSPRAGGKAEPKPLPTGIRVTS